MEEIARFFWERWRRALQLDCVAKRDEPRRWIEAVEWMDAYKNGLSSSKRTQFEKEWNKLNEYYHEYHNADPKKQAKMKPPYKI
jgi:hypothetical protein